MVEVDLAEEEAVCLTKDVTEGSPEVLEIGGTEVAIFYIDGEYQAIQNTCPHQGGPLSEGKIEDGCVYCPWHGWQFDIESGEHAQGLEAAETYDVHVNGDKIYVI